MFTVCQDERRRTLGGFLAAAQADNGARLVPRTAAVELARKPRRETDVHGFMITS
jgi:hypothetical protein